MDAGTAALGVAAIGAAATTIGHVLNYRQGKRTEADAKETRRIATGNGKGDLSVMGEATLAKLATLEARFNDHIDAHHWHGTERRLP